MNPPANQHHVNILSASSTQSTQPLQPKLPCQDLLDDGRREEYLELCVPLHKASMTGDWKAAKNILGKKEELIKYSINRKNETALHVAVSKGHIAFVKNLVSLMEKEHLVLQDNNSYTAFCLAVSNGDVKMAEILLKENNDLIDIPNDKGMMPLHIAVSTRMRGMVEFLYDNDPQSMQGVVWTPEMRSGVLLACVEADFFDVALQIINDQPELALSGGSMLRVLAQKPHTLNRGPKVATLVGIVLYNAASFIRNRYPHPSLTLLRIILTNIAKLTWTEINGIMRGPADDTGALFLAAEVGNFIFIVEVIEKFPDLVHEVNNINQSIFHVAISHRHQDIYSLLYKIGSSKDRIITLEDQNGNNMLHLVGIYSESAQNNSKEQISGPAHKMQRELLWFKEVERMLPFSFRLKKNALGFTPRQEFTKYHKDLLSCGERWIKETGAQLMVVAALLATISFAATITFAGGYNQDRGYPVLRNHRFFGTFIFFDSMALLCSSVSIMLVLSLLTSPYEEDDFWISLHYKLMLSVATVIMAIFFLNAAFACNLYLLFGNSLVLGVMAIVSFVFGFLYGSSFNDLSNYFYHTTVGRRVKFSV